MVKLLALLLLASTAFAGEPSKNPKKDLKVCNKGTMTACEDYILYLVINKKVDDLKAFKVKLAKLCSASKDGRCETALALGETATGNPGAAPGLAHTSCEKGYQKGCELEQQLKSRK